MAAAAVGADKKGGKRRLAPAVMFALLGASLLAACAPLGPQTVEPIVEPANTTEAVATVPSYAELVAEAMGGGFDPESLEPGRAAALEQLRQTFFVREYDTDGDQQLDGPILSELGENTVQWAVDGVTPYLAGEEINEVYGGGTDTALLVSGFRPGEPLVVSVAGANAELVNQGVPANGKYLVVMSPTQAVVTDERSNPVAEVGADGVWRVVEAVAVATEVPTETPEPTAEPTPEPEVGMQNEQGQWWDGAGWQSLPEGEGWQVSVEEDGSVKAVDGSGLEHTWENGGWVQERTLASGLEAFANSGVAGQLEMVYSVHPEIVINEEPAKNFYNYFIEVVTTSKGFEPYWQALGLWDHASIMNYLEQNNYRVPTQVGEQFWPTIRFIDESYIINGRESDWVRGDQQLAMVDLSKIGFILTNNDDLGTSGSNQYIDQLYGQGNIGYLGIGFGAALRYAPNGTPIAIIKEVEASLAVNVSLLGRVVDNDYLESLIMHETTLLRALSTTTPKKPEANNCMIPGLTTSVSRGACIPDRADGVQNGRVEYHGAIKQQTFCKSQNPRSSRNHRSGSSSRI